MRCLIIITATVVATFGAGSPSITAADARRMVGAQGLSVVPAMTQQVDLVCRRAWNGYRWVRSCYETGPRYYDSGSSYYYGAGPSIYFGFGGLGFPITIVTTTISVIMATTAIMVTIITDVRR